MQQRPRVSLSSLLLFLTCLVAAAEGAHGQEVIFEKRLEPESVPEPGGILIWTLHYQNLSPDPLVGLTIRDVVPEHTTFVPNSLGFNCSDGDPAGTPCTISLGTLPSGNTGNVRFLARIDDPLPITVTEIVNCAMLEWQGGQSTARVEVCSTVPLEPRHDLALTKTDGGLSTTPGGLVPYTLRFTNFGGEAVTGVVLTESVPLHTRFDAANSAPGWICQPNGNAGSVCRLAVGNLAAGASNAAVFSVQVLEPLSTSVLEISNTATIADDGTHGPDADTSNNSSSDTTPVLHGGGGGPAVTWEALKEDILPDPNHDGGANPGEAVIYLVTLRNTGRETARNPVFSTAVDPHTTLLNGTVTTSSGAVVLGNGNGETSIQVELSDLAPNAVASIEFTVVVEQEIPEGLDQLSCQGQLTGENFVRVLTDDPETAAPSDPTVTPVLDRESGTIPAIPTLGTLGLAVLITALVFLGLRAMPIRRRAP